MKNIRTTMNRYIDKLDERWQALPIRKQRRYALYFFMGYLLFAAGIFFNLWYGSGKPGNVIIIEHIEKPSLKKNKNPVSIKDTLSTNNSKK